MRNFAREHFIKHQTKKAAEDAAEFGEMQQTTLYQEMRMALQGDQGRLKMLKATERKVEMKANLFENYVPYIDGILETRPNVQDDVLATMLVWAVDINNYDYALDIMEYMLQAKINMPDAFERSVATFVYEQVALKQIDLLSAEEDEPFNLDVLLKLEQLLHQEKKFPENALDMVDQVKARFLVALGRAELKTINGKTPNDLALAKSAKEHLETAIRLDDRCRGKKDRDSANKLITDLEKTTGGSTS